MGFHTKVAATDCLPAPLSMPAIAHKCPSMNDRSAVLQFMWPFVRPYWRRIALAMPGLAVAAAQPCWPLAKASAGHRPGFRRWQQRRDRQDSGGDGGPPLAQGIGITCGSPNIAWVNNRVVNDIRQRIYAHLLTLSPAFFERERVGDVLSRLTNDTRCSKA